jgi:hypothetical protein
LAPCGVIPIMIEEVGRQRRKGLTAIRAKCLGLPRVPLGSGEVRVTRPLLNDERLVATQGHPGNAGPAQIVEGERRPRCSH